MFNRISRRALACALFSSTALVSPAMAQVSPYPLYRNLDENGVDVVRGDFILTLKEGSIGSGEAELELIRTNNSFTHSQWDNYSFRREVSGSNITIRIGTPGGSYEHFSGTSSTSNYTVTKANGASLTGTGGNYTYTSADGTKITFFDPANAWELGQSSNFCQSSSPLNSCDLLPKKITRPNNASVMFDWQIQEMSLGSYDWRLASVTSSHGYSLAFVYETDTWVAPGSGWKKRTSAQFRNTAVGSAVQASVGYAYPGGDAVEITDMAGKVWRVTDKTIRRPDESSDHFTVTTNSSTGVVTSVVRDGVTIGYNRVVNGNIATLTKTNPLNQTEVIVTDLTKGRPSSIRNGAGKTTSFTYDSLNRLKRVTQPEGNYVEYTLDDRGNATQTQIVGKSGSSLSLTTSAVFPSTCTNPVKCNKPESTTDERGRVTNFVWDDVHGGLTSLKQPVPNATDPRPETWYAYALLNGEYQLTGIFRCQTQATCSGGQADEVKTTIGYDANGNPTSISDGSGAVTIATRTMTYDARGNLLTVNGPLADTTNVTDTIRYRYDAGNRITGLISADPDAQGSGQKMRATRTTYDSAGRVKKIEQGTVDGQADSDWSTFASAETLDIGLDGSSRVVTQKLSGSTGPLALTQLSYDLAGRLECSAIRMNVTAFGSPPSSACSLGLDGSDGKDRITKTVYDAAGRPAENRVGVAVTGQEVAERTLTYTDNGLVQTFKDGENNLTTYEYDGLDRLKRVFYPVASKGAAVSSTDDFEQFDYNVPDNIIWHELRGGGGIAFTFDNLGRLASKDLPGSEPDVSYTYDLLGRLKAASQPGQTLSFTYDALGRNLTQTSSLGVVTSQWDAAGRRTKLVYPGSGLELEYDYRVTGEMARIRENGATSGIGVLASFNYDNLGRRSALIRGNNTSTTYAYDPISRLQALTQTMASGGANATSTFGYNPASQIKSMTRVNDGNVYAWGGHYTGGTVATSDGKNRLATLAGAPVPHDARGNLITDPDTGKSYGYTSENLLVTGPGGVALNYDPLQRLSKLSGSTTTQYGYDGNALIAEFNAGGTVLRRFVHGSGEDEPIVQYEGSSTGDRRFFHADERGSIIAMSGASGQALTVVRYDEFGQAENPVSFAFTGQRWLPELGLYYYKARMYAPHLGRFMQSDPIGYGDNANLYTYVSNDPANRRDPSGLCGTYFWVDYVDTDGDGKYTSADDFKDSGWGRDYCGELADFDLSDYAGNVIVTGKRLAKNLKGNVLDLIKGIRGTFCGFNLLDETTGFLAGINDGVSFGQYTNLTESATGWDMSSTRNTNWYSSGQNGVAIISAGRLGYAGIARSFSSLPGPQAVAARNSLKGWMSGYGSAHPRTMSYEQAYGRYGSDAAVAQAASRTNKKLNAAGAYGVVSSNSFDPGGC